MDALLVLLGAVVLAWLAPRSGVDSRAWPRSAEHRQAALGLTWRG